MKYSDLHKKRRKIDQKWKRLRARRSDPETTMQYTPQDIDLLASKHTNGSGIIRPNTDNLHLPPDIEALGEARQTSAPPRIMLVIMIAALIFIATITYLVAQMPEK
jgi:hypothetical protein